MSRRSYGRRSIETSNEDKVLFPDAGLTKGDLIDYYERIAPRMLPHLRDRALVVQRFPAGIDARGFYQKQIDGSLPEWVDTVRVALRSREAHQQLVVCNGKATLACLADRACVALHPWLSRRDRIERPDQLVVDVDPPNGDFASARRAAIRVRELWQELGLTCFAKLTGSEGVHVIVPLDRSGDFDEVRAFARDAMRLLAGRHPDELTVEQRRRRRRGRVYLDIGRNAYGQTAVAPWSVRALPGAPIAVPISWRELGRGQTGPRDYTVRNVFRRIAHRADPWAGMRRHRSSLGPAGRRLARLRARQAARS